MSRFRDESGPFGLVFMAGVEIFKDRFLSRNGSTKWDQHEAKNGVASQLLSKSAGVTDGTKPKAH
jgi:hypothetical protein